MTRLLSLRHEFPTEWHQFLNTVSETTGDHKQAVPLEAERFPFYLRDKFLADKVQINKVHVLAISKEDGIDTLSLYLPPQEMLSTKSQIRLIFPSTTHMAMFRMANEASRKGRKLVSGRSS